MIFHKLADLFPLLDDFEDLVKDMRENGQIEPIIIYQGEILDGRNRYLACQSVGIEPKTEEYTGPDPFKYVISKNLHRRHLTTGQRAMIAADIANMSHGGDRVSDQALNSSLAPVTQTQAAEALKVGVDSVKKAAKIKKEAPPEIVKAVKGGKMSLNAATKATKTDKPWGTVDPKNVITREPVIVTLTKEMIETFERDLDTINEIQKKIIMFGVQVEQLHPLRRQQYASTLKNQKDMWEMLAKHMIGGDNVNLRNLKSPHCNIDIPLFKDEDVPKDVSEP